MIEPHEAAELSREAVLAHLAPHLARWQLPDDVIFAPVPLTATGKIDKKALRDRYRRHLEAAAP